MCNADVVAGGSGTRMAIAQFSAVKFPLVDVAVRE